MSLPLFRQFSPGLQLLFLFLIHFLGFGVAQGFLFLIARPFWGINLFTHPEQLFDLTDHSIMALNRIGLILMALFIFITPVLIFRRFMELPDQDFLFMRRRPGTRGSLIIVALFLCAYPVINFLQALNLSIDLPALLGNAGERIMESDKVSNEFTMHMILDPDTGVFLVNLFIIGLITALSEELFFRAGLLRIFTRMFRNVHAAIWFSAFIFSIYHGEFSGCIPRFFMGAMLGYVFVLSGNIWLSILLHFLNNTFIVTLTWLSARGYEIDGLLYFGMESYEQVIACVLAVVIGAMGIVGWRKTRHYQMESELLFR